MTRRDWWLGMALVSLAIVVHTLAPHFDWRAKSGEQRPLRVWIESSNTYKNVQPRRTEDFEETAADDDPEHVLQQNSVTHPGCIVLTRNKQTADRLVSIAVTRFLDGGDEYGYGEAVASMTKRNGDIVLTETFRQPCSSFEKPAVEGQSWRTCDGDIGYQPVAKVWETLCGAASVR